MEEEKVKYTAFDGDVDNEDSVLKQTQLARMLVASELMNHPGMCATDTKMGNLLVKLLGDMDKQILTKRKIAVGDKSATASQDIANILREAAAQRGVRPVRLDSKNEATGYRPPIPELPTTTAHIDGELAPVGEQIDVDLIMRAAFDKQRDLDAESDLD